MQAKPEAEVGTLSGARQVPLMRLDQLTPGVIFTGIAADHVHEVVSVEGNTMRTKVLPHKEPERGHTHAFTQHNNTSCQCGVNQYADLTPFLPEDGVTPKLHILVPTGPLVMPSLFGVYLLIKADGTPMVCSKSVNAPSGMEFPIISRCVRIWELPHAAQAMVTDAELAQTGSNSAEEL